jgi:hypothetical protein
MIKLTPARRFVPKSNSKNNLLFLTAYHTFYYSSLTLGMLTGVLLLSKTGTAFRWLALLMLLTFISEAFAKYLSLVVKVNNSPVYHVFTLVEFVVYAQIYRVMFVQKRWRRILQVMILLLVLAGAANVLFFQGFGTANTNTIILENLFLIFLSLCFFNKLRDRGPEGNILRQGVFWFNSAVLFYYSFNILIWGFHSIRVYQLKDPPFFIYYLNLLLSGLLYIVFSYALLLNVRAKKLQYE